MYIVSIEDKVVLLNRRWRILYDILFWILGDFGEGGKPDKSQEQFV